MARVHSGECTGRDRRALDDWLAQSEDNRREYEEARQTWIGVEPFIGAIASEMEEARAFPAYRRFAYFPMAAAALVLLVLTGGIWLSADRVELEIHRTAKGEQKELLLADGSTVVINTDTELSIDYSKRSRTVLLRRGEALFSVAEDDDRPFEVLAGGGRIRDIGTRFSVHSDDRQTSVVVVEGIVVVTTDRPDYPRRLAAGEHLSFTASGSVSRIERVDAEALTAWRQGYLVLDNMPLAEVVQEIARYHDTRIEIEDPGLRRLRISGTFDIHNLDGLITAIEAMLPVDIIARSGRTILLKRAAVRE